MTFAQSLLPEFDTEMATTRRLLERVPADKGPWKPHTKSFPLGHLAQLVATMPGWITRTIRDPYIDLASGGQYTFEKTETLLTQFDQLVQEARAAIAGASDEDLAAAWSLKHGDRVIFSSTKGETVRQTVNHLIHHRGQLSVYLRLLDVPLPSIYGPTADAPWG